MGAHSLHSSHTSDAVFRIVFVYIQIKYIVWRNELPKQASPSRWHSSLQAQYTSNVSCSQPRSLLVRVILLLIARLDCCVPHTLELKDLPFEFF